MRTSRLLLLGLAAVSVAAAEMPAAHATFPGTNGRIAWSRDGDIFTMRSDGSGKRRLTDSPRNFEWAEWSPDGETLAVIRNPVERRPRIVLMDRAGLEVTPLARARYTVQHMAWSPDCTRIAYCDLDLSDPDAEAPYPAAIKVVEVATGTQSRLTEFEDKTCSPSWSPDGTQLAFDAGDSTDTDIYIMNADGTNQIVLTTDSDTRQFSPEWSPSGDVIAFVRPIPAPGNQGDQAAVIETIGVDGTGLTTLTEPVDAFDGGIQWSPDGTHLAFYRLQITAPYETHLGVVAADGSGDALLSTMEISPMEWSPDSTIIAFSREGNIFTINADGTEETKIAGHRARDVFPSWQAR